WHFVAYTYDGTTNRLYVDGVQAASSSVTPTAGAIKSVRVGGFIKGGWEIPYNGLVDDFRVYTRALSATEVVALYVGAEKVGGTLLTSVNVGSGPSLTGNTPAHTPGVVNVYATTTSGTGELVGGYTYGVAVTSVSPVSGSTAGGTGVTVNGAGFVTGSGNSV